MWLLFDEFRDLEMRWLDALGRATTVAQSFERNCKYVTQTAGLLKGFESGRIKGFCDVKAYSEGLVKELKGVGVALSRLRHNIEIGDEDDKTLRLACEARNYFAHEGAEPCLYSGGRAKSILEKMPHFEEQVHNLAHGDNLVSGWVYEIEYKESVRLTSQHSTYVNSIVKWVLAPFEDLGADSDRRGGSSDPPAI